MNTEEVLQPQWILIISVVTEHEKQKHHGSYKGYCSFKEWEKETRDLKLSQIPITSTDMVSFRNYIRSTTDIL